ncbi:PAP2-domain-containing protein, partial [Saccharata proteae CBS 121410]
QKLPFSKKKLPKKVVLSYVLDYVIIVVFIAAFYALDAVEPYHQHFALQNYTLQYPYAVKERVPVLDLCIIAVLAPAIVIAIYTLLIDGLFSHQPPVGVPGGSRRKLAGRYRMKDRLWELNCGILGLLLSVGAAFTITGTLKNAVGKPRPDLIDRCQPVAGAMDPVPYGLSNHSICTQTDNAILKDGFRSFPSGHSSTAFGGLYYLSIYLAAKMHLLDSRGEVWKSFIILVPTLAAALVAASRIMDARHHPFDVISGSLIGILTAWGSYRQYFPPVSETWRKGRAYPIRSWGKEPVPPEPLGRTDEGVEPLRGPLKTINEDRPLSEVVVPPGSSDSRAPSGGNVFRQQISNTQRHRQLAEHAYSNAAGTPSSVYTSDLNRAPSSTYTSNLPASNPFTIPRRRVRGDGYTSSSSEDEH